MAVSGAAASSPAHAACSLGLVITACIELTPPVPVALGDLDAGRTVTSGEQQVAVSSNQNWGLRISSDAPDGRMREWTGTAYAAEPLKLSHPMEWALTADAGVATPPEWKPISGTPATVVSGRPATACVLGSLCGTRILGVRYRQAVGFPDRPLAAGDYRIVVTYTAQHGF